MRKLLPFLFGLGLWISLLLGVIDFTSTRIGFYQTQYQQLNVAETIGIDEPSLMRVTELLLDYLKGDRQDLDIEVVIDGQTTMMFNQRELDHMIDVQVLYVNMLTVLNIAFGVMIVSLIMLVWRQRQALFSQLWQGYLQAATVIGTFLVFIAVYAALDFRSFWIFFHQVLFTNDLWLLNPATDRLILMVPEPFFFSLVNLILLRLGLLVGFITTALYGLAQGLDHRKLKYIAVISMTVDHIGYLLFPDLIELRIFGRLAFPLFAFLFAHSLRYTHNPQRFQRVLWISAVLTQVAFYFVGIEVVNILFLFAVSFSVVEAIKNKNYLIILVSIVGLEFLGVDYGIYGLTSILWFYYFYQQKHTQFWGFVGITLLFTFSRYLSVYGLEFMLESITMFMVWGYRLWIQVFAGFGMVLALSYDSKKPQRYEPDILNTVERYAFYVYYPLHLVFLALIGRFI